jgi:ABC-type transport system involved in multi-copper enzyme maturation permease subunit
MDIFTVRHSSWYVLVLGIVVVLLLIIGIVSLTSPHATIIISPQVTLQNAIGNIVFMSEDAITADTQVPLHKQILPFEIQKKYTVATYDTTKVHRASGKIKIINTRAESLRLKPQTRVVFEDVVYKTQSWIEVPAAKDSTPGELIITITADALSAA